MQFPITALLSPPESASWLEAHMHPGGLHCPDCGLAKSHARVFRYSKRGLPDYRCLSCQRVYNLYSETVFAGGNLSPAKAVLLLRGICKGESSLALSRELNLSRTTVHLYRQKIQKNAHELLDKSALADERTETDEMFQNAGEKRSGAS